MEKGIRIRVAWVIGWMLVTTAFAAAAGGRASLRSHVEMSMLITASINIQADGSVGAHRIDRADKVPGAVRQLVDATVSGWRFQPVLVGGKPAPVRTPATLRIVAKPQDDGGYQLSLGGASFGRYSDKEGTEVTAADLRPPKYPPDAYNRSIKGTVYVILKIGRDGSVLDAAAEQVNLTGIRDASQADRGREWLADATVRQARHWRFNPPNSGEEAGKPFWLLRIPVAYYFNGEKEPAYGAWEGYVRGPKLRPAWVDDATAGTASDALIAGGVYPVGSGPKLLTPLTQG
jgi:hypothetical protein